MKLVLRIILAGALMSATAAVAGVAPAFAAAPTHNTITVTCSNGYTRTVSANAARGVATSLTKFNAFTKSGVTCASGPGAPRPGAARTKLTITCTNGFMRVVDAHAAQGQARAITNFNKHDHSGVTCSAA